MSTIMILLAAFTVGVMLGIVIGLLIDRKRINKVIKEAKEQLEISKRLTKNY